MLHLKRLKSIKCFMAFQYDPAKQLFFFMAETTWLEYFLSEVRFFVIFRCFCSFDCNFLFPSTDILFPFLLCYQQQSTNFIKITYKVVRQCLLWFFPRTLAYAFQQQSTLEAHIDWIILRSHAWMDKFVFYQAISICCF